MNEESLHPLSRLSGTRRTRHQPHRRCARSTSTAVPHDSVTSESESESFRSPLNRRSRRKKSRPSTSPVAPATSTSHRYPLRSRVGNSTRSATATGTQFQPHCSNSPILPQPAAVTPAQQVSLHRCKFPALYTDGVPKCRCPRHCTSRDLLAFDYQTHYGEGYLEEIKQREARENEHFFYSRFLLEVRENASDDEDSGEDDEVDYDEVMRYKLYGVDSDDDEEDDDDEDEDDDGDDNSDRSPLSTDSVSNAGLMTPRPRTVISTKARVRLGNTEMRFLEEHSEFLFNQPFITERMRTVLVSWLVEVSIEYSVSTAAYHLGVSLLDYVLDCGPNPSQQMAWRGWRHIKREELEADDCVEPDWPLNWFVVLRRDLQALGCACLWIASKMEDRDPPAMGDFQYISDHTVCSLHLREMERRVCQLMQFRLQRLTPVNFLPGFLRAGRTCKDPSCTFQSTVQHNLVMYLITLGRLSYSLSRYGPSTLAASALYLSRVTLGMMDPEAGEDTEQGRYWSEMLTHYTGYSKERLKRPVFLLYNYYLKAEELNVAVYQQFAKSKYDSVSVRTVPRMDELDYGDVFLHDDLYAEN